MTAVLIVDDQRTFADALAIAIELQPGMRVAGNVASVEEALPWVEATCPEVVLLDVNLPGMSGTAGIREFRSRCPGVRIIVLSATATMELMLDVASAGADAFVPKTEPFEYVLEAIHQVQGHSTGAEVRSLDGDPGPRPQPTLTPREHEILVLLASGVPAKQIARQLDMSIHTCRGHIRSILHKLDAHSQLAAVVAAAKLGLLPNL